MIHSKHLHNALPQIPSGSLATLNLPEGFINPVKGLRRETPARERGETDTSREVPVAEKHEKSKPENRIVSGRQVTLHFTGGEFRKLSVGSRSVDLEPGYCRKDAAERCQQILREFAVMERLKLSPSSPLTYSARDGLRFSCGLTEYRIQDKEVHFRDGPLLVTPRNSFRLEQSVKDQLLNMAERLTEHLDPEDRKASLSAVTRARLYDSRHLYIPKEIPAGVGEILSRFKRACSSTPSATPSMSETLEWKELHGSGTLLVTGSPLGVPVYLRRSPGKSSLLALGTEVGTKKRWKELEDVIEDAASYTPGERSYEARFLLDTVRPALMKELRQIEGMNRKDPALRACARLQLCLGGDTSTFSQFLEDLGNIPAGTDKEIYADACAAAGRRKVPELLGLLDKKHRTDFEKEAVLLGLSRIPDERIIPLLLKSLERPSEDHHSIAVALHDNGVSDLRIYDVLLSSLTSFNKRERYDAMRVCLTGPAETRGLAIQILLRNRWTGEDLQELVNERHVSMLAVAHHHLSIDPGSFKHLNIKFQTWVDLIVQLAGNGSREATDLLVEQTGPTAVNGNQWQKQTRGYHGKHQQTILETLAGFGSPQLIQQSFERVLMRMKKSPSDTLFAERSAYLSRLSETLKKNIFFPNRFDKELLTTILKNRERMSSTGRPLAVMIYPQSDHNQAFADRTMQSSAKEIAKRFDLQLYEAGNVSDLKSAIADATRRTGRKAELIVFCGHGTENLLALGTQGIHPSGKTFRERNPGRWDISVDSAALESLKLGEYLQQDGQIILVSCSTGKGGAEKKNIANYFRKIFPQAGKKQIFSPQGDAKSIELEFNGPRIKKVKFDVSTYQSALPVRWGDEETRRG